MAGSFFAYNGRKKSDKRMETNAAFSIVPDQVPYSSALNNSVITELLRQYPFLKSGEIGWSVMGKPLRYLSIGSGGKQLFYSAAWHANEWITTPVLLKFVEDYARAYAAGQPLGGFDTEKMYEGTTLFLVPMVNPDGVDLVNGMLESTGYERQAEQIAADYPDIPYPSGWKANIEGTDLNLQFPAGWERARETKFALGYTSPAPRDYVGSAPLVAPESAAVEVFTVEHDFSLILAYHTQGETIYWKYADYEPEDSYRIAQYFGTVSGYQVEQTPAESGYAGYKDWFIQTYNRPGYTIEVGRGVNPLPLSQFPQIYRDNLGILLGGMSKVIK